MNRNKEQIILIILDDFCLYQYFIYSMANVFYSYFAYLPTLQHVHYALESSYFWLLQSVFNLHNIYLPSTCNQRLSSSLSLSLFSPLPFSLSSRPLALLLNMRIICGPTGGRERESERRLCWRQRRQAARFRHISHFAAKSIKPEMHVVTSSHTSPAHTCCIRLAQEINLTSGQSARAAKGQEGWPGQAG